jgi:hypothetical protein
VSRRIPRRPNLSFVLLLGPRAMPPRVFRVIAAQPDASDQEKRQQAMTPFSQGKRLEALPLVEELVQKNARDAEALVALAACLIDHAAPPDQDARAKQRFRARHLVQKAWQLGTPVLWRRTCGSFCEPCPRTARSGSF